MTASKRPGLFPETAWSAILKLKDSASPDYGPSLERLAALYWKPIYWVIRRSWARSADEARDLTQEFFAEVVVDAELFRSFSPQRGSFRALVRAALTNFMRNQVRDRGRQKRGGGVELVSADWDVGDLDTLLGDAELRTPEERFDAAWETVVLERAIAAVEAELAASGRAEWMVAFRRYDLDAPAGLTYEALAAELGWTPRKLRRVLDETRAAFRAAATRIVREYSDGPEQLRAELKLLLGS